MRQNFDDLAVFMAVGKEGSFTRAAAALGVSPSAVSQLIRNLEERLGVRLLTRTTRSVALTQAGEQLLKEIAPLFERLNQSVQQVSEFRDKPAGVVRISADEFAIRHVLWPKLLPLLERYPDLSIELTTDYALTDIVAQRYDAGVRLGGILASDMISIPLMGDMRLSVVASPEYLQRYGTPKVPNDLTQHRCINLRLPTHGGLFAWEFSEHHKDFHVRVTGPLILNSVIQIADACCQGFGLAQLPEALVQPAIEKGALVEVLRSWSQPFEGYHLYYPSRRQPTAAFKAVLKALRK